ELPAPIKAVLDPPPREHLTGFVHHAHVVVGFRPVDPNVDHAPSFRFGPSVEPGGGWRQPNGSVLEARHPTSRLHPLTGRRGHDLNLELSAREPQGAHPPAARAQHALRTPSSPIRKPLLWWTPPTTCGLCTVTRRWVNRVRGVAAGLEPLLGPRTRANLGRP